MRSSGSAAFGTPTGGAVPDHDDRCRDVWLQYENCDLLPINYFDGSGTLSEQTDWEVQIAEYMTDSGVDNYGQGGQDQPSPAIQCPSAQIDGDGHASPNTLSSVLKRNVRAD